VNRGRESHFFGGRPFAANASFSNSRAQMRCGCGSQTPSRAFVNASKNRNVGLLMRPIDGDTAAALIAIAAIIVMSAARRRPSACSNDEVRT
jgi:hypothetical protein